MLDWKWIGETAAISVAVGVASGFVADRIISWRNAEKAWEAFEEYSYEEDDEFPDIPEGVNVVDEPPTPVGNAAMYEKPDLSQLVDYTKYSKEDVTEQKAAAEDLPGVEIISEEEFVKRTGNLDGYVTATGTWFPQEFILAGWNEDLVEKDPASTVGEKAIEMFEDPTVDAVYVRNDVLKVLFEIVRSDSSFDLAEQEVLTMEAADPSYSEEG